MPKIINLPGEKKITCGDRRKVINVLWISNESIPNEVIYTNDCSEGNELNEEDIQEKEIVPTANDNSEIVEESMSSRIRERVESSPKEKKGRRKEKYPSGSDGEVTTRRDIVISRRETCLRGKIQEKCRSGDRIEEFKRL